MLRNLAHTGTADARYGGSGTRDVFAPHWREEGSFLGTAARWFDRTERA